VAVALGLIHLITKNEQLAVKYLLKIRPEAMPLPRILRFWDQILDSNLCEAGEWIRFEALKQMRGTLEDSDDSGSSQLNFEEFKKSSGKSWKKRKRNLLKNLIK
jgi:hypothetical protein